MGRVPVPLNLVAILDIQGSRSVMSPPALFQIVGFLATTIVSGTDESVVKEVIRWAIVHDMRRSAVRTFERAGVPRSTAVSMVGHKTESIYRRYAIVDEQMQREAVERLDAYMAPTAAAAMVVPLDRTDD